MGTPFYAVLTIGLKIKKRMHHSNIFFCSDNFFNPDDHTAYPAGYKVIQKNLQKEI